jgi:DNA-binding transcriptional LysR family regulator
MQWRNVDLNLLVPLRALLEERSVSRAAARLHMSQPSLSASLARLRRHFGDELLLRVGNSYELTPLAAQLLERSHSASLSLERVFQAHAEFDPTTSTRTFTIFSSDFAMAMLGGPLASVLAESAPGVSVQFENMTSWVVNNAPDSIRDYDGLLLPHGFLRGARFLDLFVDRWVCVVAPDNTEVGEVVRFEQLAELPWVQSFSAQTQFTPAAKQLQMLGVEPRVEIGAPGFLVVPSMLAGTNRIALMQESYARQVEAAGIVRVVDAPFDVVPFLEAFWWNAVHDRDPEHIWLRSMLSVAVARSGLTAAPTL